MYIRLAGTTLEGTLSRLPHNLITSIGEPCKQSRNQLNQEESRSSPPEQGFEPRYIVCANLALRISLVSLFHAFCEPPPMATIVTKPRQFAPTLGPTTSRVVFRAGSVPMINDLAAGRCQDSKISSISGREKEKDEENANQIYNLISKSARKGTRQRF